ncbi:MAG: hypothetical protein P1P76_05340 [Anaerolineales bacterium]|nr:hypothetical protein [Anaerolineales bacterium]
MVVRIASHFLILFALAAACAPASSCPATTPNASTPPGETPSETHHGNGALWTALWPDGEIIFSPDGPGEMRPDGSLAMKFPWWRAQGVEGAIKISGRRLDQPAGGSLTAEMPDGYGDTGFQASALVFPSEGCWEVAARAGEAELIFTVEAIIAD